MKNRFLTRFRNLLALIMMLPFCEVSTSAIVTEVLDKKTKIATIKIVQAVESNDHEILKRELDILENAGYSLKLNAIQFNSNGGNVKVAKLIGREIRKRELNTYIAEDKVCKSACIFAFMGGVIRMPFGLVEVHRPTPYPNADIDFVKNNMKKMEEEVSDYLKEMGAGILLSDAILMTPSWRVRELTDVEMRRWGIASTETFYEELWFRYLSITTGISIEDITDNIWTYFKVCMKKAKKFETTFWDCQENALKSNQILKNKEEKIAGN